MSRGLGDVYKRQALLGELRNKQAREARRKAAQQMENTL